MSSDRVRIAAGTVLVLAGAGGVGLTCFSAVLHHLGVIGAVWWELLVPSVVPLALGWGILGNGRFGAWDPVLAWRTHPRILRGCVALAGGLATTVVVIRGVNAPPGSYTRSWWLPVAAGGAISVLVAATWWWRTPDPPAPPAYPSRQPPGRLVVSLLLAVAVGSYVGVGVQRGEMYPFSAFPMYSGLKSDPHLLTFGKVRAHLSSGATRDLQAAVSSSAVRNWIADEEPDRIATLAGQVVATWEQRTGNEVVSFEVLEETWQAVPYPGPAEVEKVHEEVAVSVAR